MARQAAGRDALGFRTPRGASAGDCVILDYQNYDGTSVRTKFWFDEVGHISRTRCMPLGDLGSRAA
jgi:hypothetical protein